LAILFAEKAVNLLCEGQGNRAVGLQNGEVTSIALEESASGTKLLNKNLLRLADMLAT
jgi:hypothetical protein